MNGKYIVLDDDDNEVAIEDNAWEARKARRIRILTIERTPGRVYHQTGTWGMQPQSRAQLYLSRAQARRLARMLARFADAK